MTTFCMKIIAMVSLLHSMALDASLLALAFDSLPVCLYPSLKGIGVLPDIGLPTIVRQLLF